MSLLQDVRFALRLLVKDRWFSAVAIGALALGIGVNATVFTLVNAVLIRGLPFPEADRLLRARGQAADVDAAAASRSRIPTWSTGEAALTSYEEPGRLPRDGDDGQRCAHHAREHAGRLDDGHRLRLSCGSRWRSAADSGAATTSPAAEACRDSGYALWQSRYRGDRGVLGLPSGVNGEPATVIGVMPPGIKFPTNADCGCRRFPPRTAAGGVTCASSPCSRA
jgi:hypothetical protein